MPKFRAGRGLSTGGLTTFSSLLATPSVFSLAHQLHDGLVPPGRPTVTYPCSSRLSQDSVVTPVWVSLSSRDWEFYPNLWPDAEGSASGGSSNFRSETDLLKSKALGICSSTLEQYHGRKYDIFATVAELVETPAAHIPSWPNFDRLPRRLHPNSSSHAGRIDGLLVGAGNIVNFQRQPVNNLGFSCYPFTALAVSGHCHVGAPATIQYARRRPLSRWRVKPGSSLILCKWSAEFFFV